MTCAFLLATLFATGVIYVAAKGFEGVWHILTLSFIVGTAQSFGGPAYQALVPSLVKTGGLAERHRTEFHPVQCGARHRTHAGRLGADQARRILVLLAERAFLHRGHRFAADHPSAVRSHQDRRIRAHQHEQGFSFIRKQAAMEGADRAGISP